MNEASHCQSCRLLGIKSANLTPENGLGVNVRSLERKFLIAVQKLCNPRDLNQSKIKGTATTSLLPTPANGVPTTASNDDESTAVSITSTSHAHAWTARIRWCSRETSSAAQRWSIVPSYLAYRVLPCHLPLLLTIWTHSSWTIHDWQRLAFMLHTIHLLLYSLLDSMRHRVNEHLHSLMLKL